MDVGSASCKASTSLTGCEWLVRANVIATSALLIAAGVMLWLARMDAVLAWTWDALPWILSALAIMKMTAAVWIAMRVFNERLVRNCVLLATAACWCGAVFGVYGACVWFVDTAFVPHYLLLLIAIVVVPLSRVSAGPLALAWNRHR